MLRPEPWPTPSAVDRRSGSPAGGGARRRARRRSRSPRDASPRRQDVGAALAELGDLRLRLPADPLLDGRRSPLTRVELVAISRARSRSSVSSSSSPASARRTRPAALIRGASRKPSAAASSAARVDARDGHQGAQARTRGPRQLRPSPRGRGGGSRRAAASGPRPSPARRARAHPSAVGAPSAYASLYATPVPHSSAHG